jgi:glycerol-3-phosphate cytidylyltransferase
MKKIIGYTAGVFDLFHIGHLNILRNARSLCDTLVVGVTTDELAFALKNKHTIIPFAERLDIIQSLKFVDKAYPQEEINEWGDWERFGFHRIFKGSDWEGTAKWNDLTKRFAKVGVEVHFLPYTTHTSSTFMREVLMKI